MFIRLLVFYTEALQWPRLNFCRPHFISFYFLVVFFFKSRVEIKWWAEGQRGGEIDGNSIIFRFQSYGSARWQFDSSHLIFSFSPCVYITVCPTHCILHRSSVNKGCSPRCLCTSPLPCSTTPNHIMISFRLTPGVARCNIFLKRKTQSPRLIPTGF